MAPPVQEFPASELPQHLQTVYSGFKPKRRKGEPLDPFTCPLYELEQFACTPQSPGRVKCQTILRLFRRSVCLFTINLLWSFGYGVLIEDLLIDVRMALRSRRRRWTVRRRDTGLPDRSEVITRVTSCIYSISSTTEHGHTAYISTRARARTGGQIIFRTGYLREPADEYANPRAETHRT